MNSEGCVNKLLDTDLVWQIEHQYQHFLFANIMFLKNKNIPVHLFTKITGQFCFIVTFYFVEQMMLSVIDWINKCK